MCDIIYGYVPIFTYLWQYLCIDIKYDKHCTAQKYEP